MERVRYQGLPSEPSQVLARQTMRGFGGVVSFGVAGGEAAVDRVVEPLRLIVPATSLGGFRP